MLACRSSTWAWTWNRFIVFSVSMESAASCGGRRDGASVAGTAVLGEERQDAVHALVGRAVDQVAPLARLRHQAGMREFLQVERQRRRRRVQRLGHDAR